MGAPYGVRVKVGVRVTVRCVALCRVRVRYVVPCSAVYTRTFNTVSSQLNSKIIY